MTYLVTHTNGDIYTTVGEGNIDDTLGIFLIGQSYNNYGQLIANNFVRLLENQANDTPPPNPQQGQLWWDTKNKVLHFFDGNRFKSASSSEVGINPPVKPLDGDQWWDTENHQLMIYDGSDWLTIGPGFKKGQNFTGSEIALVTDTLSNLHTISLEKVDGVVVSISNKDDPFILTVPINGILNVGHGITLVETATITGTASDSLALNGIPHTDFVRYSSTLVTLNGSLVINGLGGISLGNNSISMKHNGLDDIITTPNNRLTIGAGDATIQFNSATGTVTISKEPTATNSVASKSYVDGVGANIEYSAKSYTDSKFSATIGNSTNFHSLQDLANAINNDPLFYMNVGTALNLKANINSPTLTGNPTAPNPLTQDSSDRIATTKHVKDSIAAAGITFTTTNTEVAGPISGQVLMYDGVKWINRTPTVTNGQGTIRVQLNGSITADSGLVNYSNGTISISLPTKLTAPVAGIEPTKTYFKTVSNSEGRIIGGDSNGVNWTDVLSRPAYLDTLPLLSTGVIVKAGSAFGAATLIGQAGQIVITNGGGSTNGSFANPVIALADVPSVPPGNYGNITRVQVDAKGRVTGIAGSTYDAANPLTSVKIYDMQLKSGYWYGNTLVNTGATHWNNENPDLVNQFVDITTDAYKDHPMYSATPLNGYFYFASTICAQTMFEFTCPQASRILTDTLGSVKIRNDANITDAFYVRVDRWDTSANAWVPVRQVDDNRWNVVNKSDGSFNGYMTVSNEQVFGAFATKTRNFAMSWPNADEAGAYYETGSAENAEWPATFPPLPANTKYRMTIQVYCVSDALDADLALINHRCTYTLRGE